MAQDVSIVLAIEPDRNSLELCLDSLFAQSRIHWIRAIHLQVFSQNDAILAQRMATLRQHRLSHGKIFVHHFAAQEPPAERWLQTLSRVDTPWVAFLSGDAVAPVNWLEELFRQFFEARAQHPLVVGVSAPCRLADTSWWATRLDQVSQSLWAHWYLPEIWRPPATQWVERVGLDNTLFQREALLRELLPLRDAPHAIEELSGLVGAKLREDGLALALAPKGLVALRHRGRWREWWRFVYRLGQAQAQLEGFESGQFRFVPGLAKVWVLLLLTTLFGLFWTPFSTSPVIIYLLVLLNGAASLSSPTGQSRRLVSHFIALLATETALVMGYLSKHRYLLAFVARAKRLLQRVGKPSAMPHVDLAPSRLRTALDRRESATRFETHPTLSLHEENKPAPYQMTFPLKFERPEPGPPDTPQPPRPHTLRSPGATSPEAPPLEQLSTSPQPSHHPTAAKGPALQDRQSERYTPKPWDLDPSP